MVNGGWYGTPEEWQRREGPLLILDPLLEGFAESHGIELLKNEKDSPGRSLRWGENPFFLIQIFIAEEAEPTWNIWICCFFDRDGNRYWRKDYPLRDQAVERIAPQLQAVLETSILRLRTWAAEHDQLEFATKLSPLPRL